MALFAGVVAGMSDATLPAVAHARNGSATLHARAAAGAPAIGTVAGPQADALGYRAHWRARKLGAGSPDTVWRRAISNANELRVPWPFAYVPMLAPIVVGTPSIAASAATGMANSYAAGAVTLGVTYADLSSLASITADGASDVYLWVQTLLKTARIETVSLDIERTVLGTTTKLIEYIFDVAVTTNSMAPTGFMWVDQAPPAGSYTYVLRGAKSVAGAGDTASQNLIVALVRKR